MSSQVVVIGAGVIGLSSALELQSAGHTVTILAKDFPQPFGLIDPKKQIDFTSPWGGAHNRWVPPAGKENDERDHELALATFQRMKALGKTNPEAGITFMKGIEYLEKPGPEYRALVRESGPGCAKSLGVEGFRVLSKEEVPDEKVELGIEYDTWCVNPMVYCSWLLNRFVYRGGKVVKRQVRDPKEVFEMDDLGRIDVVVNASGQGFGDEKVFITRGQTCLVANTCEATVTRQNADGSWTFCVPRNFEGGTVIGGTKEPDNWDPNPSLQVRETLIRKFLATYPSIADQSGSVRVLKDVVGRRPTRHGGARLEKESVGQSRSVVHAYGLGGRGYEMSWGVAETVSKLVEQSVVVKARI
ncbi:hypothetical protein N0V93_001506 [Gnomoniopsis smithogilvyi]|uniref:FAD dependent oxidoreductase domain-containing protein n=1 Tax=Gnomoniopsis smithogilvyi TaxID=1191159 RepID=A0A9W8Z1S5_9PEZI|nr:hypothetical protein N0V93_001506 [Gnomoniopsis smithogilvyi]